MKEEMTEKQKKMEAEFTKLIERCYNEQYKMQQYNDSVLHGTHHDLLITLMSEAYIKGYTESSADAIAEIDEIKPYGNGTHFIRIFVDGVECHGIVEPKEDD